MKPLIWTFDGEGAWEAPACFGDGDTAFSYRIEVCEDGSFDVSRSDAEIGIGKVPTFDSLAFAKGYCQDKDDTLRARFEAEESAVAEK